MILDIGDLVFCQVWVPWTDEYISLDEWNNVLNKKYVGFVVEKKGTMNKIYIPYLKKCEFVYDASNTAESAIKVKKV